MIELYYQCLQCAWRIHHPLPLDDFHKLFNIPPKIPFIHPFYMLTGLRIKMLSCLSLMTGSAERLAEPFIKLREMPYQL